MEFLFSLTVQDILQRHHFNQAKVVAGEKGLNRIVKWVHVTEVTQVGHLLNGYELILTTGVGWGTNEQTRVSFLKQLIDKQVSALCVELGIFFEHIPEEMIEIANEHHFPILVFEQEVRFIDIIQDLSALFIQQHYKLLTELENSYEIKKRREEAQWVKSWLENGLPQEDIQQRLQPLVSTHSGIARPSPVYGYAACVIQLQLKNHSDPYYPESLLFHMSTLAKSILEQYGFLSLSTTEKDQIIYVFVDQRKERNPKERLKEGIEKWMHILRADHPELIAIKWGVGKWVNEEQKLHESWKMAATTIRIQDQLQDFSKHFYEDLHIYRLFSLISNHQALASFVQDYIGPVLAYDRKKKGDLYVTLKTFLECNGSKQETASRLFVVRQTLYHRLQKLENLLGKDFLETEKRMAIEFAIYAYEYMRNNHPTQRSIAPQQDKTPRNRMTSAL